MRTTFRIAAALSAAAFAFAGCGITQPAQMRQDSVILFVKTRVDAPKEWRVAVAPVEIVASNEPGTDEWIPEIDAVQVQRAVAEALSETGVFKETCVEGEGSADLRLILKITGATGRFKGVNGNGPLQFLLWWGFSSLIGCLVADEDYELSARIEASLEENGSGEKVWSGGLPVSFSGSLDHYQKGLEVFDLFPPGTFLAGFDPPKVTETLWPHLLLEIQRRFTLYMAAEKIVPAIDVLVVSAGGGENAVAFTADARAFAAKFAEGRRGFEIIDPQCLTAGESPGPKKSFPGPAAILGELKSRTDIRIRDLVFYYAGRGTLARIDKNTHPAILARSDPAGAEGEPESIHALLGLLASIPASSRCAVFDAGFEGEGVRVARPAGEVPEGSAVQWPVDDEGAPSFVIARGAAAAKGQGGAGLLTGLLIKAAGQLSDNESGSAVMLNEAMEAISWELTRALRRAGAAEQPLTGGTGVLFRSGK